MSKWELPDDELKMLDKLAHINLSYLLVAGLSSFYFGTYILSQSSPNLILGISLIGFSGSAVAALTSCLNRYSTGFEKEVGNETYPPDIEKGKQKFNRRFARWLFIRPFLGAIVAPVFISGLQFFIESPEQYLESKLGFTSFMAGLLAKSVLELIKGLFKNVFKG